MAHLVFDLLVIGFFLFCIGRLLTPATLTITFLRAGLAAITLIGGLGTVLGYAGLLYPFVFTGCLVLSALAARWWLLRSQPDAFSRRPARGEVLAMLGLRHSAEPWTRAEIIAASLLGLFLLLQLIAAAGQTPAIYDSLSYRLTRIAWWLQEGSIWQTDVIDSRLNFMPQLADLQMLWVTGHWFEGYPGTALPQWWGGAILLASTYALVRAEGASRLSGLFAAILVAGMPLAAVQFSTDQTDLFTAGLFAAGLALFRSGLNAGRLDPWAALALGLSFASKPSVVFALPGLLLWAVWLWWSTGRPVSKLGAFCATAAAAALLLAGPRLVENRLRYGSWLSSPEVASIYLRPTLGLEGLAVNLRTSALQALTPGPCPEPLRAAVLDFVKDQGAHLPENDPDQVQHEPRAAKVEQICQAQFFDADAAPPGPALVAVGLLVLPLAALFWTGLPTPRRAAVLGGVAAFALFCLAFLFLNRWHPYWFRFLSLPAPWLAVSFALLLDRPGLLSQGLRCVLGLLSLATAFLSWSHCRQSGWQNLSSGKNHETRVWSGLTTQVVETQQQLMAGPVTLLLPYNSLMAGYFRTESGPEVRLAPAAAYQDPNQTPESLAGKDGGWVISMAEHFPENFPPVRSWVPAWAIPTTANGTFRFMWSHLGPKHPRPGSGISRPTSPGGSRLSLEVVFGRDGSEPFVVTNNNPFAVLVTGLPGEGESLLEAGKQLSGTLAGTSGKPSRLGIAFRRAVEAVLAAPLAAPVVQFAAVSPFILPAVVR